jgi:hypothetical protein
MFTVSPFLFGWLIVLVQHKHVRRARGCLYGKALKPIVEQKLFQPRDLKDRPARANVASASTHIKRQSNGSRSNSGGYQWFVLFNEPITMTGVPKPQARGLASLKIIVERSRKRTVNS